MLVCVYSGGLHCFESHSDSVFVCCELSYCDGCHSRWVVYTFDSVWVSLLQVGSVL